MYFVSQYISTLIVLIFAFLTGTVCVIMIVISSRRRPASSSGQQGRKYNAVRYRREMRDSSLTRRDPSASAIKPFGIGNIQLPTSQDDASLESRLPPQTSSATTHLERDAIFLTDSQGSSESSSQGVMLDPHEKTPLLHSEQRSGNSSESELNVGLGTLPSAGVWARDTSGTQLTRFVVLLIFLLFSCLIVSIVYVESGIVNLYWSKSVVCTYHNLLRFGNHTIPFCVLVWQTFSQVMTLTLLNMLY